MAQHPHLIGQIQTNREDGLDPYRVVIEATVPTCTARHLDGTRRDPGVRALTQSVFWGSMAYTVIGGTAVGTALILLFLPALYAICSAPARPLG